MGGKMKHFKPEGWLMDTPENRAAFASSAALRDAYFEGRILEARALLCDKDHNLHVDLGCMEGIIPREEAAVGIEEGKVRDIAIISRVNKPVMFRITGFDADALGRTSAILSRRSVQLECMETDIARLTPGRLIASLFPAFRIRRSGSARARISALWSRGLTKMGASRSRTKSCSAPGSKMPLNSRRGRRCRG